MEEIIDNNVRERKRDLTDKYGEEEITDKYGREEDLTEKYGSEKIN